MSDIKKYILSLSAQDRISLITFIATSLEESYDANKIDIPQHIIDESREIFKAWDQGKFQGIPWRKLKDELRSNYLNV